MVQQNLLLIISLLLVIFSLMMVGEKLRIAFPIFLVLGGLVIGFLPDMFAPVPLLFDIDIDPELVFLLFLPPLLYEAAWGTSWHDFWKNRGTISGLGFGLVIFTSGIVAYLSSFFIGSFSIALGFLVGAIISPPDAVAATSVLRSIRVPKGVLTVLEGESLVNDAASLIVFRFALAAVTSTQVFVLKEAAVDFAFVTFGGIFIGVFIAFVIYIVHKFLPTNINMDVVLTFISPYLMYIGAERFHMSGVMAVVSGGLFLSYRYREFLNYQSHMQAMGTWKTIGFVLNGIVFILIGLQLPIILRKMDQQTLVSGFKYGLIISLFTILIRIFWVYVVVYLHGFFRKIRGKRADDQYDWKQLFIIAWAGMRGVISLAAAFSIPAVIQSSRGAIAFEFPFPDRNLILLIVFVVILITLVFQGLTLPFVIKLFRVDEKQSSASSEKERERFDLRFMGFTSLLLHDKYAKDLRENPLVAHYLKTIDTDIANATKRMKLAEKTQKNHAYEHRYNTVVREVIRFQREELRLYRKANLFAEGIIRKKELELDLIEARLIVFDSSTENTYSEHK